MKQVIQGPDADTDRITRAVRDNGGQVPNKLVEEFPVLADEGLAAELAGAQQAVFDGTQSGEAP